MDSTIDLIRNRRSIRVYTQQSVPRATIEEIIDCARLAPTAMNEQPWDFVVITDKTALASMPPMLGHAEFIANAAFAVLVLARDTTYGLEDCCAATENLLLAGAAHGLGACWVAGSKQEYAPKVAAAFGAPADRQLVAIISFGYPAESPQVDKKPLGDVLHWDRF
jgi:nitroreductase